MHLIRRFSENIYFKSLVSPGALSNATTAYTDTIDHERWTFLILVGTTDRTSSTIKVVQATDASGTGAKDVTGAALTTGAVTANANKIFTIEVERSRLDIANGYSYLALSINNSGGTATNGAVVLLGHRSRMLPPTFGTDVSERVFVDG